MADVEHVLAAQNELGESPLWSVEEGALYWVDQLKNSIHRYDPTTGAHDVTDVGVMVGCIGFREKGGFVLATAQGFAIWNEGKLELLGNPEADNDNSWFNDGKVDRQGRFWAGTMGDLGGNNLYRLDPDGSIHHMESDVAVSNGIAWSLNEETMYYQDTMKKRIYAYDFDAATGSIENRRIFVDTADDEGLPDGMTVDSEGFIWSVRTVAGFIRKYDPNGRLVQKIKTPVKYSTSCIFGGDKLDTLYITSLRTTMYAQPDDVAAEPELGDLFRMTTDTTGVPEPKFKG